MYNLHKLISIYLCVRGRCHICTTYSETVRRHGDTNMCDDQGVGAGCVIHLTEQSFCDLTLRLSVIWKCGVSSVHLFMRMYCKSYLYFENKYCNSNKMYERIYNILYLHFERIFCTRSTHAINVIKTNNFRK